MQETKIERQFIGNVGMFLVAAKLSSMNMIALPTSRNTKGYDIVVLNPQTDKGKGIQVKSSDKREFPVVGTRLRGYEEKINEKIVCDYVFVDVSSLDSPRFFTVPKNELKEVLKDVVGDYIHKTRHRKPLEELMASEKTHNWVVDLNRIMKFEEKWQIILNAPGYKARAE